MWCRFSMAANGCVYETFGISKRFPVKLQPPLIRADTLDKPLTAKCFIHVVSRSVFIFSVIFLSICYFVSVCRALALVALLQFLVLAFASANCKCATKCVGYFPFIAIIISSKLSMLDFKSSIMSFAKTSGSGKLSRSVRLSSFIQLISRLVLSLSIISW